MSWDEKLFSWGMKMYDSLVSKPHEATAEELNQVQLEEVAPRLKILASALTSETIEIKEAEAVGGLYGSTLLLPPVMAVAPTRELNTQAYILRVAYSAVAHELGFLLPEAVAESDDAQYLYSILVAPKILREVEKQYPSLVELIATLKNFEFERRKDLPLDLTTRVGAFDSLVRSRLGNNPREGDTWLLKAANAEPEDASAAKKILAEILPDFSRYNGHGKLQFPSFLGLIYSASKDAGKSIGASSEVPTSKGTLASGTERKAKARERVKEIKFSENKEGENPIVHAFEKLRTAADYTGGRKSLDGSDELEEHLEALEELDLRNVIRTHERTDSVYKADIMLDANVADLEEVDEGAVTEFIYDEWDEAKRTYKRDWCKVFSSPAFERLPLPQANEYIRQALEKNQRQTRELRLMFEEIKAERRWRNRQTDGPEIDIDAVVDRYATVKSGHTPKDKLYMSRRRAEKDYATLVLLDSSLSTDSWIEDRRVMDILKESMLILSEVIPQDRIAIGAFYSNTRNDCRYVEVKDFASSWAPAKYRLASLKPTGYTRIGPALRHATYLLSQVPAKKKLLLLISDGKPTDFDRYEGKYGIGDIRQAIREASAENIMTRALAIDVNAKFYLPQMFGAGNFQILPHPGMLSKSLAEVYSWLMV